MPYENWNRINELFYAALDRAPEQRNTFLKEACGSDSLLQQEIESLLAAYDGSEDFIRSPASKNALEFLLHREVQLDPGDRIGAYNIVREIERGGMGAVYLGARADELFEKSVAIKIIKRGMDTDEVLRHFRNEQQILGNFDHPNIARLMDAGCTDSGLPYFIMEHVEGQPIDRYCDQRSLSITNRLELFQQVCAAVSYAHRNLVVHRDIKPSNILVTPDGVPKLLDFGIAKILQSEAGERSTATGIHFMTPEYASPEQAQGQPVTTLSDVYSLGVLLYELLTGHSPYRLKNRSALEVMRTITETQPELPSAMIHTVGQNSSDGNPSPNPESVSKTREGSPDRLRKRLRGDLDNIVLMAMRKEPQRRYQSVDQLSEDIHRHLQALPITARKDTLLYSTARFVLRNRITVAITVLALLIIAFSSAVMQWRANKQAKLFQEFGQEVTRIESAMRYAYLLPLHNIQKDKKQVTDRLEYIKKQMQEMGSVSYGPGFYSLGRGYLSLHRYQEAYDNLILAWQKHQYQEPAAANALGLSLAMLYQEKLREAEQLYSNDQLSQRKLELEKQYRLPAQQYIQRGANASEAPEYVQAMLSFLEKQYPEALNKAHAAEQNISWHYESRKLQGDIFAAMANDQSSVGNTIPAAELYQKAKASYLEAAMKGQSDPQIYEGLCALQSALQEMHLDEKGTSTPSLVKDGISYCEKALIADSQNVNANLYAAKIYTDLAYAHYLHGADCSAETEKAADFARAALKIDPQNGWAYRALGNAYRTLAAAEIEKGGDPLGSLELARANLEKASQRMPEDAELLSTLGANYINQAQYEYDRGQNSSTSLDKAIQSLKKAVSINPKNSKFQCNLGIAYCRKGIVGENFGVDSRATLKQAVEEFKKSISNNSAYVNAYIWAGLASNELAHSQEIRGENPIPAIDEAITMRRKALELDPENAYSYHGLGKSFLLKARYMKHDGKDPTPELQSARENYEKSILLNDKILSNYESFAEVELEFAKHALAHNKQPGTYFEKAHEVLNQGLRIDPESYQCFKVLASLHLLKAEYLLENRQSPLAEIQLGIKAADRSIDYNPKDAEVYATRGKLFLLRARLQFGSARLKASQEAVASIGHAFELNRNLEKKFGKDWEEAKRLVQNQ